MKALVVTRVKRRQFASCLRMCLGVTVLLLATIGEASAQRGSRGSLYSRLGLGELRTFGSSQAQAMGSEGFGLTSTARASTANPAGLGDQVLTWAAAGFRYETVSATDAFDNSSKVGFGTLDHVMFSFPILTRRLGLGASFAPFSRVGYTVRVEGELDGIEGVQDTTRYDIDYSGTGGLQKVDVGLGYNISRHLAIGANVNFVFGLIDESQETAFDDPDFVATRLSNTTRVSGITGTFGLQIRNSGTLREGDDLAVGVTYSLPTVLDGRRVLTAGRSLDRDTLGTPQDVRMELPWRLGAGIAYAPSRKLTLLFEGRFEPWTRFESDVPLPGLEGTAERLEDRLRLSAGVEILPAGTDLFASYLSQVAYRVGFFVDKSYVQPLPGEILRTYGAAAGLSLPTRIPGTRIDINLEVGRRGRAEQGLIRETYYRIGVNVNIGERWFFTRPLG